VGRLPVFARLFPASVGTAEVAPTGEILPIFPEEAPAIARAVIKRRIEFAAGRHCARMAMRELGHSPCGIPRGADRAPVWPEGLVGSITHSSELCAAVVAPIQVLRSVGIDMEKIGAVPEALKERILRPDETSALDRSGSPGGADWLTLYFCLKEAAYKAFYPVARRMIEFQQMRVRVNAEHQCYVAEPPGLAEMGNPVFRGRYRVRHGRIHAACWYEDPA
jgi:4'-phosphopantetheinyl transferase EntD